MEYLSQHIHSSMEIVFFFYGTAFLAFGIFVFAQPKKNSGFALAGLLPLLAWFGVAHGLSEYMEMWALIESPKSRAFGLAKYILLAGSFLPLLEFGRRSVRLPSDKCPAWKKKAAATMTWHILPAAALLTAAGGALSADFMRTSAILARYLLCFPGAVLTGLGFLIYYKCHRATFEPLKVRGHFLLTGGAFLAYGVLGGLITPEAGFFPASRLNYDSFIAVFGVPVQVFRALCAIAIAYGLIGTLKLFNWEIEERTQSSFFENSRDCIADISPDGRIISMNGAGLRLHGLKDQAEAAGKPAGLNAAGGGRELMEAVARAAGGGVSSLEYRISAGGGEVWLDATVSPITGVDGSVKKVLCVSRDVTRRRLAEEERHRSAERLAHLLGESSTVIYSCAKEPPYAATFISENVKALTGYAPEAFTGDPAFWSANIHPDDAPGVFRGLARLFETGSHRHEYRWKKKDGTYAWIFDELRLVKDAAGNVLEMVGNWTDVTPRKLAEERLLKSNQRLKEAQALARTGNWELDIPGNRLFWSDEVYRLFELDPGGTKLSYEFFLDAIHPEDREAVDRAYTESLKTRSPYNIVYRLKMKDGRVKFLEEQCTTFYDDAGRPLRSSGTVRDVTETRQKEEEILRLSETLRQAHDSVIITDTEGLIIYVNAAFRKYSGYADAEILGKPVSVMASDDLPPEQYRRMWEILRSGNTWEGRLMNRRKDGSLMEMWAVLSPIRDASGRITAYASLQRDMTAENELQEQIRQSQKLEAVGLLAGGIAHDFNNVIMAIGTYAKFIADQAQPGSTTAGDAAEIIKAAQRTAALTRQLLIFSRRKVLRPEPLDLNAGVAGIRNMLSRLIGEKIAFELRLADRPMVVKADPGHIEQVLVNLAVNARDAMPEGGKLTVSTEKVSLAGQRPAGLQDLEPGDYVLLKVSDTGCGMTKEVISKIFVPFFTTKQPGRGTGLGLSTVYGIIKQSGGGISVISEPGKGSVFGVYLPATGAIPAPAATGECAAPAGLAGTIMVVDDDEAIRTVSYRALSAAGLTVLAFKTAEDALAFSRSFAGSIDVLLTDIVMPGMDGFALARELVSARPGMKVLFMSGYADQAIFREGIEQAEDRLLAKPVDFESLIKTIAQLTGQDCRPSPEL